MIALSHLANAVLPHGYGDYGSDVVIKLPAGMAFDPEASEALLLRDDGENSLRDDPYYRKYALESGAKVTVWRWPEDGGFRDDGLFEVNVWIDDVKSSGEIFRLCLRKTESSSGVQQSQ
ncbi:hypothetical protein ACFL34_00410 [Candidatus Sumerlaeota bacterium]